MNERHSFLSATLAELNRRKVLKTVGAYAVAVFVLLQLMDAAVEPLRLPDALPTIILTLLEHESIICHRISHTQNRQSASNPAILADQRPRNRR